MRWLIGKRSYLFWGENMWPSYFVEVDSEGLPCAVCVGWLHQGGRVLFDFVFLGEEALRMLDGRYLTFHTVAIFNISLVVRSSVKNKMVFSLWLLCFTWIYPRSWMPISEQRFPVWELPCQWGLCEPKSNLPWGTTGWEQPSYQPRSGLNGEENRVTLLYIPLHCSLSTTVRRASGINNFSTSIFL